MSAVINSPDPQPVPPIPRPCDITEGGSSAQVRKYKTMKAVLIGIATIVAGIALIIFGAPSTCKWAISAGIGLATHGIVLLKKGIESFIISPASLEALGSCR